MKVTLLDGSQREYSGLVSLQQIASDISGEFARQCIGALVDGKTLDMSARLEKDCQVEFVTISKETDACLEILRHSVAHLLAQAVKELFPSAQIGIGPVIENGFYYDFLVEKPFQQSDLKQIKERMVEIAKRGYKVERKEVSRKEALEQARKDKEPLKELIIEDIPADQNIIIYSQGNFTDICRGPHVPNTSFLKYFELTKVSGSYWKGDSKNQPMQRIYGTAWAKESSLSNYLKLLEEAEARDHRKLGQELDLFHQQSEAPGDIFWHPNGYTIYILVQQYIRKMLLGTYKEVKTPQLVHRKLWEQSGHWSKFKQNMFTSTIDDMHYALKPMNCPCHVQIFKQGGHSYRELPLRMSEFGCCHRHEPSGATHGIMRLRAFTQDDAHIFCEMKQVQDEAKMFIKLLLEVYQDFGFTSVAVKLSTRPEQREGDDELWDISEKALEEAVKAMGMEFTINPGEGAFYGPKLEFVLKDAIGRDWQCGTLQVDMVLPKNLNAQYTDKQGQRSHPVMLHRAILGSLERFIGILIENYSGKMPFWLSPAQVVVCGITSEQDQFASQVNQMVLDKGFRSKLDIKTETMNYKIRHHIAQKIPYIVVVGKREAMEGTVSLRKRDSSENISVSLEEFLQMLQQEWCPGILAK